MLAPLSVRSTHWTISKHDVVFTTEELLKRIQNCASQQFTGQLDFNITNPQQQQWKLFFSVGSLIGCDSKVHPVRRWFRQLSLHCPSMAVNAVTQEGEPIQYQDYESLATQAKQGQIPLGQMAALVEGHTSEVLFDIIQAGEKQNYHSGMYLSYRVIPQDSIDLGWVVVRAERVWQQVFQDWQAWQQAGLADISPNLAPKILQADQLRQQTSPSAYRNLTAFADGTQTLRDLAVKLKQSPLPLTHSIAPYIQKNLIGLIEVEDLKRSILPRKLVEDKSYENGKLTSRKPSRPSSSSKSANVVIAYIDDSKIDTQMMGYILEEGGYKFVSIQDSVQALVKLLENKPDLIFLDLVMPVANGYEICSQIRRVSVFQDIPVIILTGNDGIVDRVRAKMVGASGFLPKPITQQKVLSTLQKYLPTKSVPMSN
ncbi:response regulator [Coleofasciculus sp. F4-SAH-05]|uniref:response regulator n=1 Tax=Coleofasciculus sp. F4-SAH-05 TaxID=3069525 RepID=UPI0032F75C18